MSPANPNGTDHEDHRGPYRLVCGLCGTVLEGVHRDQARADEAADEHATERHPARSSVIILTVPAHLLAHRRSEAIAIAEAAQRQVDERSEPDDEQA